MVYSKVCVVTHDIMCFSGYQNLIKAIKSSWLLALLTTMKIHLISTTASHKVVLLDSSIEKHPYFI